MAAPHTITTDNTFKSAARAQRPAQSCRGRTVGIAMVWNCFLIYYFPANTRLEAAATGGRCVVSPSCPFIICSRTKIAGASRGGAVVGTWKM